MTPKVRQGIRRVWNFARGKLVGQLTVNTVGFCWGFGVSAHWSREPGSFVIKVNVGPADAWCTIGPWS